jgi:hypothetical protein
VPVSAPEPTPVTPPPPASLADVQAALASVENTLKPGASAHVARLLADELRGVSPALLGDAVRAKVASDAYEFFRAPTTPQPGSLEAIRQNFEDQKAAFGGIQNVRPDGKIDLAGDAHRGVTQHGTVEAQAAALQQVEAARWNSMSSAERLEALGRRYRDHRATIDATSGLVVIPHAK